MIPWITKNVFYLPIQFLRGEPVVNCLREIEAFECLSGDEMTNRQLQKLHYLLKSANSENQYYRDLFRLNGIDTDRFQARDDFQRIPLLSKKQLKSNFSQLMSRSSRRFSLRTTSGSTGTPLRLAKDRLASAYMEAFMHHCYSWYGIEIGHRQARIWGVPLDPVGFALSSAKDLILNRKRLPTFDIGRGNSLEFFRRLLKFQPYYMYGLMNPIHEFARHLADSGVDAKELNLGVVIATGERLNPSKKEFVEQVFGCRVVNEYGCTESGIIAFECPMGNMHLGNHNLYVELLNPETLLPVAAGEPGEVVITELHATRMPLIRYRLGDMAVKRTDSCSCGRNTPLIGEIVGRVSEMIPTPDGRKISCALLDYAMPLSVSRFRATLVATNRLVLLLECEEHLPASELAAIRTKIGSYLGDQMEIETRIVEDIPCDPSGKLRCFNSELEATE